MSRERKILWVVLLVAFGLVLWYRVRVFSVPPQAPTPRLVLVTGGSGPYWQLTIDGAKAAAKKLKAKLQVETPAKSENLEEQLDVLKKLQLPQIDGVAVSPVDAEGETEEINSLCEQLKVVTFDSDAPDSKRHSHVGTSNFSAGRACARLVGEAIPEGGQIGVFLANTTKENLIDRKGGFAERIARMADDVEEGAEAPKYVIVGYFEDGGSDQKCIDNLHQLLEETPDVKCLVALNARQGPILLKELDKLGKLDQIKMVTFDANKDTLDGIEAGHIYATIAQDPYKFGYEAVSMLVKICQGEDIDLPIVGRSTIYVGFEAIRKENLDEFRKRLQTRQRSIDDDQGADQKKAA